MFAHQVVAVVGASGGGKSSILSLLQHFYEPCRGEITVDGIAVREYKHGFLHRAMSTVSQEPAVFARKIAENITYGMDNDEVHILQGVLKTRSFVNPQRAFSSPSQ